MISYNNLGKNGRLGNQMFQYAATKGIAKNRGFEYSIPDSLNLNVYQDHQLLEAFKLSGTNIYSPIQTYFFQEQHFHFDEDIFMNCLDHTDLNGYFQSYKYFDHIREELLEDFTFNNTPEIPQHEYVAVHVRRGDYVNQPGYHPVCDTEYYKKAMDSFDKGIKFLIFSDDIEWCKQQEIFQDCLFSNNQNNIDDLYLMSNATHNIIANSSFSWWAAYLNKNSGDVICPERWFGTNYSHYDMSDLRPKKWIQL